MSKLIFELPDCAYFYKLELFETNSKTPSLTIYGTVESGDCAVVKPSVPSGDD